MVKTRVGFLGSAALGLLTLFGVSTLEAQQVRIESGATTIDFGGRVQLQGGTSSCSDYSTDGDPTSACEEDVPGFDMFVRRVRLTTTIEVNEWISARFQPEFGKVDEFRLADAYGRLDLAPDAETSHARITLGHFKRPFDLFALMSSTEIPTIERALLVRGLSATSFGAITADNRHSDRDIGVMVDGGTSNDRFHYWVGAFNGGRKSDNEDDDTGKQLVARAQMNLSAGGHPVKLGIAGSWNTEPFTRADESLASKGYNAWEVFAEMGDFGGGPHLMASVVGGQNSFQNVAGGTPDIEADEDFADLITWQAIGSWKFDVDNFWVEGFEPVLRISMADPNRDVDEDTVWGLTPGFQVFFDGRNKVALSWDIISFADDRRSENSFKVQYQLHF